MINGKNMQPELKVWGRVIHLFNVLLEILWKYSWT